MLHEVKLSWSPRNKVEEIERILSEDEIDLWALRELCLTDGGLVNDSLRRKVWPRLVGVDSMQDSNLLKPVGKFAPTKRKKYRHLDGVDVIDPSSIRQKCSRKQVMAKCLDARQIDLDIGRCTWHLLTGSQRSRRRQMRNKHRKKVSALLKRKQRRLGNLINLVLIQSYANSFVNFDESRLRYYQGYHDISCIFLSALGGISDPYARFHAGEKERAAESDFFQQAVTASKTAKAMGLDLPSKVLLQISQSHLGDSMRSDFDGLTSALRLIVMPLILQLDPEVHDHLKSCQMEPFFCFPWIISWFSHDIRDTSLVKRLFDVFIVSHPLMPIYMSIAMVLHPTNKEEVLNANCDFASIHKTLTQLPRNSCSVGWKFVGNQFGGGYISADDDTDDKVSIGSASILSEDIDRESLFGDEASMAPSLSESTFSGHDASRVPFQELIDLSIKYMRLIPPRNLVKLAHKYHGKDAYFLAKASSTNLFQQPPNWALRASTPSLKSSLYKKVELTKRHTSERSEVSTKNSYPRAVIACGMGLSDNEFKKKRIWYQRRLRMSAIIVGVIAISSGLLMDRGETLFGLTRSFANENNIHNLISSIRQKHSIKDLDIEINDESRDEAFDEKSTKEMEAQGNEKDEDNDKVEGEEADEISHKTQAIRPEEEVIVSDDGIKKNLSKTQMDHPISGEKKIQKRKARTNPGQIVREFANSAKAVLAQEAEVVLL